MAKLVVEEEGQSRELELSNQVVVIGRDLANEIVIRDKMSSRRHCRVQPEADGWALEDLKSSNGTLLNGRTSSRARLTNGDVIRVGEVCVTYCDDAAVGSRDDDAGDVSNGVTPPAVSAATATQLEPIYVRIVDGPEKGQQFQIAHDAFGIGRRADNDLVLSDKRVSAQHARVVNDDGVWYIEDLDSGNGIVTPSGRVRRHALRNNEALTLGDTQLTFVGLPVTPTEAAIEAAGPATRTASNRAAPSAAGGTLAIEESQRIVVDLEDKSNPPLQALFTTIFSLSFLVILYTGFTLVRDYIAEQRPAIDPDNVISNSSFEEALVDGAVPDWQVDESGDAAKLALVDKGAPDGRHYLKVEATASKRGYVRVRTREPYAVSPHTTYELSGLLRNRGFEAAFLEVSWWVRHRGGYELLGESISPVLSTGTTFAPITTPVTPPDWAEAELCRVAIAGLGTGSLEVDRVSLKPAGAEDEAGSSGEEVAKRARFDLASRVDGSRDLQFWFEDQGTFAIKRGNTVLIRNVRLAALGGEEVPFGQLLAVTSGRPRLDLDDGSVRSSFEIQTGATRSLFQLQLERVRDAAKLSYRQASEFDGPLGLLFELGSSLQSKKYTVFDAGNAVARDVAFNKLDGVVGDEVVIGERLEQSSLRFSGPVRIALLPDARTRSIPTLAFVCDSGLPGGVLDVFFSTVSAREQTRIANQKRDIEKLRSDQELGHALEQLAALAQEFDYRADVQDYARTLRSAIETEGQRRLDELTEIEKDYQKFGSAPVMALFVAKADALERAFDGTAVAERAKALRSSVVASRAQVFASANERAAAEVMKQGEKYYNQGHDNLARVYFEMVLSMTQESSLIEQAKHRITLIEARN